MRGCGVGEKVLLFLRGGGAINTSAAGIKDVSHSTQCCKKGKGLNIDFRECL